MSPIKAIAGVHAPLTALTAPSAGQGDFAGVLRGVRGAEERQAARAAAGQLVASTFILPVLAELREDSFLTGPFAPDFGERQFQPLLDQQIADQVTRGANLPLVDVIVNQLLGAEAAPPAQENLHGR